MQQKWHLLSAPETVADCNYRFIITLGTVGRVPHSRCFSLLGVILEATDAERRGDLSDRAAKLSSLPNYSTATALPPPAPSTYYQPGKLSESVLWPDTRPHATALTASPTCTHNEITPLWRIWEGQNPPWAQMVTFRWQSHTTCTANVNTSRWDLPSPFSANENHVSDHV